MEDGTYVVAIDTVNGQRRDADNDQIPYPKWGECRTQVPYAIVRLGSHLVILVLLEATPTSRLQNLPYIVYTLYMKNGY